MDEIRILIVDDNKNNQLCLERAFQMDHHSTKICDNGLDALQEIKDWNPHLVILDVNMPKMTGLEVLKETREIQTDDYIGIILVTANSDLKDIISGLDSGADDYIVKPFRIHELKARARSTLRIKKIHDELLRANKRLHELTTLDYLTGLRNMGFTYEKLENLIEQAKKDKHAISVMMFDMDNFKLVNDNNGHLSGSQLLIEVSKVMKKLARENDIAARFGGDEFFLALPYTKLNEAKNIAEELREEIENKTFHTEGKTVKVTASFGVAGVEDASQKNNLTPKSLIKSADDALYVAKASGKNIVKLGQL